MTDRINQFMNAFLTALRKELLEQWRTRRLLVLAVVLVFFGMSSPLVAKLMPQIFTLIPGGETFAGLIPEPVLKDAVDQYNKNIGQFGVLLALLLSMGAVAQEKERGTAALMLVKPLPRAVFILSKFKALALSFLAVLLLAGLAGYYYTLFLFGPLDALTWLGMNLLLWVQCMVYIALTMLFSTLFRSQTAAAGASFAALLVLAALGAIPRLGEVLPGQLAAWAGSLYSLKPITAWPALWVSLGIIVVCLAAACILFEKQEI